jgi:hypothetical protein
MGDLSANHPEMLVGTGPFVFVQNTPSTLTLARNPFYYQTMDKAAIRYEQFGETKFVEGITVTALAPSIQIRPYKIRPVSWDTTAEARLIVPVTNLDTNGSSVIDEKIELIKPDSSVQVLLDGQDIPLAPLQVSSEVFELHGLEKGEYTIRVSIEVTGGQLYDYVTANLPQAIWQSILGHEPVEKKFWVTTLADINEGGVVNIIDIATIAVCFGSKMFEPLFRTEADINLDHKVNILDIVCVALDFGWHY